MQGPNAERDTRIIAAARLGQSHEAIGKEHGITRARVTQIVSAAAAPRSPAETTRQLIAKRYQDKWNELQEVIDNPPIKTTSIGRTQWDPRGCTCGVRGDTRRDHAEDCKAEPVLDVARKTDAIKAQISIQDRYREMFGVDIHQPPGPLFDDDRARVLAEIIVRQHQIDKQVPRPALPDGYHAMIPEDQARADVAARRAQLAAVPDDTVIDAEIVDE